MADQEAKRAAQGPTVLVAKILPPWIHPKDYYATQETSFRYSAEDHQMMEKLRLTQESPYGVMQAEGRKQVLLREEGCKYVTNLHQLTHLGAKKLKEVVRSSDYYVIGLSDLAKKVVKNCKACALTNARPIMYTPGKRLRGDRPGAY